MRTNSYLYVICSSASCSFYREHVIEAILADVKHFFFSPGAFC
jgi:hypothetical protein